MTLVAMYSDQQLEAECRRFGRIAISNAMDKYKVRGTEYEIHYLRALEHLVHTEFTNSPDVPNDEVAK